MARNGSISVGAITENINCHYAVNLGDVNNEGMACTSGTCGIASSINSIPSSGV